MPSSSEEHQQETNNNNEQEEQNSSSTTSTTKPPYAILIALTIATVNESLGANMLLPFVGNLISSITGRPLADSGFSSGLIVSAFHLGQAISGTQWGKMSDALGRRPVIFSGLIASAITQLLFGFSSSIWMLIGSRFLQGVGNGNMATIKTCVAEITTKETEAFAFSLLTLSWGLGTLAGQSAGGLLYDPVNSYNLWPEIGEGQRGGFKYMFKSFLLKYPALPPCAVGALYGISSLLILMCYLVETNKKVTSSPDKKRHSALCCCTMNMICCCCCASSSSDRNNISSSENENDNHEDNQLAGEEDEDDDNKILIVQHDDDDNDDAVEMREQKITAPNPQPASPGSPHDAHNTSISQSNDKNKNTKILPKSISKESLTSNNSTSSNPLDENGDEDVDFGDSMSICDAFSLPRLRVVLICYMLLASHDIAFVECYPLLAVLAVDPFGGFGLSVKQLGLLNTGVGITQISANILYPIAYAKAGVKLYPISAAAVSICNGLIPFFSLAAAAFSASQFFGITISWLMVRQLMISFSYTSVSIMLKNSSPKKYLGFAMGVTQSAASFTRLLTPAIAAPFFAFTANNEFPLPRPFNVSTVFLICCLFSAIASVYAGTSMKMYSGGILKILKTLFCGCCCDTTTNNTNYHNTASRLPTNDEEDQTAIEENPHQITVQQGNDDDEIFDGKEDENPFNQNNNHLPSSSTQVSPKIGSSIGTRKNLVTWNVDVDEQDDNNDHDDDITHHPQGEENSNEALMPWEEEESN